MLPFADGTLVVFHVVPQFEAKALPGNFFDNIVLCAVYVHHKATTATIVLVLFFFVSGGSLTLFFFLLQLRV